MKALKKTLRGEVKKMIIANNGNILNKHVNALCSAYEEQAKQSGIDKYELLFLVTCELHYFAFSKQQSKFRQTYNYHNDERS